jgi:hypothetical protein
LIVLDQLTCEDFTPHKGQTFELFGPGGRVEIKLLDARPSPHPSATLLRRKPFAILFVAPKEPSLGMELYNIKHPVKGLMEGIFITPVVPAVQDLEKAQELRFYEAVFA